MFEQATEEYRATLRMTLFNGVPREKYEALIVALLQLRTPKLSEHLDPEELSGLLSRSLPPVDADDVAEIAEGFERLDRHAEQLHALEEEAGAARRLADVARRYARRVLRAAADRLTRSTSAMDSVARRARGSATALADTENDLTGVRTAEGELAGEHRDLTARAEGIQLLDAYQEGKQLPTLRADTTDARRRAEAAARTAADATRTAGQDAAAAATMRDEAAAAIETARRSKDLAADAAALAGRAALVIQLAGIEDLRRARALLEAGLAARRGDVETMQRALAAHADAVRDHTGAERRLETAREEHAVARSAVRAAGTAHADAVTALAEELTSWGARCGLLDLGPLPALAELAADERALTCAVDAAITAVREGLTARRTRLRADRDAVAAQREEVQAARDAVATQRDVPPPAPYTRAASRDGRTGAPLWRVVAFTDDLSERDRAGVEAALEASGLLDTWIQPEGTLEGEPLDTFADSALGSPAPGGSLCDVLVVEPDSPVAADRTERLLAAVAHGGEKAFDHPAALGVDGSWRLGLTHGRMTKPEPAYIGAAARQRARARRLAELDEQLHALDTRLSELDQALEEVEQRRARLAAELAARPSHEPVRVAARAWDQAQAREAARADALARAAAETGSSVSRSGPETRRCASAPPSCPCRPPPRRSRTIAMRSARSAPPPGAGWTTGPVPPGSPSGRHWWPTTLTAPPPRRRRPRPRLTSWPTPRPACGPGRTRSRPRSGSRSSSSTPSYGRSPTGSRRSRASGPRCGPASSTCVSASVACASSATPTRARPRLRWPSATPLERRSGGWPPARSVPTRSWTSTSATASPQRWPPPEWSVRGSASPSSSATCATPRAAWMRPCTRCGSASPAALTCRPRPVTTRWCSPPPSTGGRWAPRRCTSCWPRSTRGRRGAHRRGARPVRPHPDR